MHKFTQSKKQKGFSLLEVLIALVIMSVGMLGIAGLYMQSLQAGRTSMFRHHAINLASDVADRIRANPRAGAAYAGGGQNNNCVDQDTDCNEADMAANDIFLWLDQADDTLPNGDVEITFNGGVVPPTYQIRVVWDEPGEQLDYIINIPVMGF